MRCCWLIILALTLTGCASVSTIERGFEDVNYSDGVSGVEAKRIAQKFLMDRPEAVHYMLSLPQLDTGIFASFPEWKGKAWVVGFSSRSLNLNILNPYYDRMFVVGVDKWTGNIRFYQNGYHPGGVPFEMKSYGEAGLSVR